MVEGQEERGLKMPKHKTNGTNRMLSIRSILGYTLAVSVLFGSGYWVGLQRGRSKGYGEAASLTKSSGFVASFQTLRLFREGDVTNGVERLEAFCYSTAADLLEQPDNTGKMIMKLYGEELKNYRSTYASPPSLQSQTEQRLDTILGRR